ncbi:MAG: DUF3185 family protein [Verrucomicrobiales bacterium]|nr:DUF3185 family protein [Verrucomicrobiales bacterium]
MNKNLGLVLIICGIVVTILGVSASESFSSELSRFFTGSPTEKSIWLLLLGVALTSVGAVLRLGKA